MSSSIHGKTMRRMLGQAFGEFRCRPSDVSLSFCESAESRDLLQALGSETQRFQTA